MKTALGQSGFPLKTWMILIGRFLVHKSWHWSPFVTLDWSILFWYTISEAPVQDTANTGTLPNYDWGPWKLLRTEGRLPRMSQFGDVFISVTSRRCTVEEVAALDLRLCRSAGRSWREASPGCYWEDHLLPNSGLLQVWKKIFLSDNVQTALTPPILWKPLHFADVITKL